MKQLYCIIILMFILKFELQSENSKLFFDANLRYRYESWNGMNAKNYGDDSENGIGKINDDFLLQRLVIGFEYKPSIDITVSAHLQDARAFGWSLRQSQLPYAFKEREKGTDEPF